jgi:hypothetical protein
VQRHERHQMPRGRTLNVSRNSFTVTEISEEAHERRQNTSPIPTGKESQWSC